MIPAVEPSPQGLPGWPQERDPALLEKLLRIHGADGDGYCQAGCSWEEDGKVLRFSAEECPPWVITADELVRLRARGQVDPPEDGGTTDPASFGTTSRKYTIGNT